MKNVTIKYPLSLIAYFERREDAETWEFHSSLPEDTNLFGGQTKRKMR